MGTSPKSVPKSKNKSKFNVTVPKNFNPKHLAPVSLDLAAKTVEKQMISMKGFNFKREIQNATKNNIPWSEQSVSNLSVSVSMVGKPKKNKNKPPLPEGDNWISCQNFGKLTRGSFLVP